MIHTNLKIENEKVVCLMISGAVLAQGARDLLLENAVWMRLENNRHMAIQHPMCCGVIQSNLEVQNYLGVGSVQFDAMLNQRQGNVYTSVKFIVRVQDLDELPKNSAWLKKVNPPPELKEKMQHIIAEIIEREFGDEIDPEDVRVRGEFYEVEKEEATPDHDLN